MTTARTTLSRSAKLAAAVVGAVTLVFVVAGPAAAHDPIFIEETQTTPDSGPYMPDGTISWALYGSVLADGDTRGFEFDLREGDELYVSLLIPNLSPEIDLEDADLPVMELEAPDGTVTTIAPEVREVFDEPFSRTSYVTLAERREPGEAGRYRGLVIGGTAARFTVAIGETEIFFTETERSGDRPSSFTDIAAPLQVWYSTPAGEEPSVELADGEAEIDLEMVEEAMESGDATAPDGALDNSEDGDAAAGSDTEETNAADTDSEEAVAASGDDSGGGSTTWVAPLVLAGVALVGAGFFLARRRSASEA